MGLRAWLCKRYSVSRVYCPSHGLKITAPRFAMSVTFRVTSVRPSHAADTAISESTDGFFKPFISHSAILLPHSSATSVLT